MINKSFQARTAKQCIENEINKIYNLDSVFAGMVSGLLKFFHTRGVPYKRICSSKTAKRHILHTSCNL